MIIEISFIMHEHLYPPSENISNVVGIREKSHLFEDCLINLQFLINISMVWLVNLSL